MSICIFLALLTVVAFWQVARLDFTTVDDPAYVTQNYHVNQGLTWPGVAWAFASSRSANWHPLTWMSHMLDCQLFGMSPIGPHIVNLLLHLANVALILALLSRMTGQIWPSAFVAALFAIHPLRVESVAWVAERKDVLSALFWLLTMLAYVRYAARPGVRTYPPVIVAYALGLMCKPMLVSLPLVLLLMDLWPLDRARKGWRGLIIEKAPLFALAAASCAITFIVQRDTGAVRSLDQYSLGVRLANSIVAYVVYLWKMVWPVNLSAIYPHPANTLPVWLAPACAVPLAAVTYGAIRAARARPYITAGWLWYVITLVPVIGLAQVGQQAMADRYTYVPLIGIFIIIAWGIIEIDWLAARPRLLAALAGSLLAALMAVTYSRIPCWKNGVALFENAVRATDGHHMVRYCLADAYIDTNRIADAVKQITIAVKDKPDFAEGLNGLGFLLAKQGKTGQAIAMVEKAIKINPRLAPAYNNMALILSQQGKTDEALSYYMKALEIDPRHPAAQCGLGVIMMRQGNVEGAIPHFEEALSADPDFGQGRYCLAVALYSRGRFGEAWREARLSKLCGHKLDPRFIKALSGRMPEPRE